MYILRVAALGILAAASFTAPAPAAAKEMKAIRAFGPWQVFCDQDGGFCATLQSVRDAAGHDVTAMVVPDPPGEAVAGLSITTPAGTDIDRGLTLTIGQGQATVRSSMMCYETNCAAQIGLSRGDLADLRRGAPVSVLFFMKQEPHGSFRIPLQMGSFREAYDSLPAPSR